MPFRARSTFSTAPSNTSTRSIMTLWPALTFARARLSGLTTVSTTLPIGNRARPCDCSCWSDSPSPPRARRPPPLVAAETGSSRSSTPGQHRRRRLRRHGAVARANGALVQGYALRKPACRPSNMTRVFVPSSSGTYGRCGRPFYHGVNDRNTVPKGTLVCCWTMSYVIPDGIHENSREPGRGSG